MFDSVGEQAKHVWKLMAGSDVALSSLYKDCEYSRDATYLTNIFNRENLHIGAMSICLGCVTVIAVVFELVFHFLEHKLKNNIPATEMLKKIYKELMIMGLISFALMIIIIGVDIPTDFFVQFEVAHIWIFLMAVIFVVHAIILMAVSSTTKRFWHKIDKIAIPQIIKDLEEEELLTSRITKFKLWFQQFFGSLTSIGAQEHAEYWVAKLFFLKHHKLPMNFAFAYYLRKALTDRITESLDVKELTWVLLLTALVINYGRSRLFTAIGDGDTCKINSDFELIATMAMGFTLTIIELMLLIFIRRVKHKLLLRAGVGVQAPTSIGVVLKELSEEKYPYTLKNVHALIYLHKKKIEEAEYAKHHPNRPKSFIARASEVILHETHDSMMLSENELKALFKHNEGLISENTLERISIAMDFTIVCHAFYLGFFLLIHMEYSMKKFSSALSVVYIIICLSGQIIAMLAIHPLLLQNVVFLHSLLYVNVHFLEQVSDHMLSTHLMKTDLARALKSHFSEERTTEENYQHVFDLVDIDGDGVIGPSDLSFIMKESGIKIDVKDFKRLLTEVDEDQSGEIDMEEFRRLLMSSLDSMEIGDEIESCYGSRFIACKQCKKDINLAEAVKHSVQCFELNELKSENEMKNL